MRDRIFLFTDIQRSTHLWSEHTDAMARAISEHNRMVAKYVESGAGELLKYTGDGVLAMFDDPSAAIRVALDMQRWLNDRVWEGVGRLRVRMGLHIGDPVLLDTGEVTGPVVNETARLHDAGHGGQVLVSDRFAARVASRLPPGCSLKPLGEHSLPDLAPAAIHQVCHPDLPYDFPPLRTVMGSDDDLVGRSTSFHGRERELRYLESLNAQRLVTLVGPGGVGKTRLAQILLARRGVHHRDGVRTVDLSRIGRNEEVVAAVATSLRIEQTTNRSPGGEWESSERQVVQWLQTKRLLLLLDNCEHVVDGVAHLVTSLLDGAPELHLICTSRQALAIEGELVYDVPPLVVDVDDPSLSPAVTLFVDRAREVKLRYQPSQRDQYTIARLCAGLDGLPLAIELAAARLAVEDLEAVASRLAEAVQAPGLPRRGRPERHSSLRNLVAWSYDLLSPAEQVLFGRLAIFSGPFTLRAVVDVCAGDEALSGELVPGLLGSLVAKSMVVRADVSATLRLLAPIRAFALTTIGIAERTSLRHRFVHWYTSWCGEMERSSRSSDEERAVVALSAEFDNLRAAHRMALEDGDYESAARIVASLVTYAIHRFRFEVANWAEASLTEPNTPDYLRPKLHGLLGIRAWMRGEPASARSHADQAVAIEEHLGLAPTIEPRLVRLAVAGYEKRFDDAYDEFNIAYQRARELEDLSWQVEVLVFSAVGMSAQGEHELAAQIAQRAASMANRVAIPTSLAWARYAVAESCHHDQPDLAIRFLDSASEVARTVSNEWVLGHVKISLARQYRRVGRAVDAAIALLEGLDRWSRAENWSEQWRTVREVALVCAVTNRYEDAATLLGAIDVAPSVIPLAPDETEDIARLRAALEDALGMDQYHALLQQGRVTGSVSPDVIVDRARAAMRSFLLAADR